MAFDSQIRSVFVKCVAPSGAHGVEKGGLQNENSTAQKTSLREQSDAELERETVSPLRPEEVTR